MPGRGTEGRPATPLAAWLSQANRRPGAAALVTPALSYDYRTLLAATAQLAGRLEAGGFSPGRPLAVLSTRAARVAWSGYLALHTASPLLLLAPERTASEIARLLAEAGVDQILADADLRPRLPRGVSVLPVDWLDTPDPGPGPAPVHGAAESVQLVVTTSGTQGRPRGAMHTAAGLMAAARGAAHRLGLGPGDRWLDCLPLHHIGGFSILLRALLCGASVVLHEGFNACRVWEDLARREITHVSLVPAMLHRLLEVAAGRRPPPGLRVALIGGGPLSAPLARRAQAAGWPLCPSYGMTEAGSQVATQCPMPRNWEPGAAGAPLPGFQVDIVDRAGRPTQGSGRIRIRGPMLMAGYANLALAGGDGLDNGGFVSSDLGWLDEAGQLRVVGRADDLLVSGGESLHPREVEERLLACPQVRDAAVIARPDPVWGDVLVALVVSELDEATLDAWCRAHIPSSLRPREFRRVAALPRDAMGKLRRQELARR